MFLPFRERPERQPARSREQKPFRLLGEQVAFDVDPVAGFPVE
jgi:hypothetical protein